MRGSSKGRKPTFGNSSKLASISGLSKLCVKLFLPASKPLSQITRCMRSRNLRHCSKGASRPRDSASRMAQSTAAQAITLECV